MNDKDSSTILNIVVMALIIGVLTACYIYAGMRNVNTPKTQMSDAQIQSQIPELRNNKLKPFEKYSFTYTYTIICSGSPFNISIKIPIPQNENEKQYISSLNINPHPTRTYKEGEDTIAEFSYKEIPQNTKNITISGIANVRTYDYQSAVLINKNLKREHDLSRYLRSEEFIESDDPMIKQIAQSLRGENQEDTVDRVFRYVNKTMKYVLIPQNLGAKQALIKKRGKCSEYAALMVALLRANGIPARVVLGNIARNYKQSHIWVEVYYNNYGWVIYDPTDMGTNVRLYNEKKQYIVNKTLILPQRSNMKYIAAQRNIFTPIRINYNYNGFGQVSPLIKTDIQKIN